MSLLTKLKTTARRLKQEVVAVYWVARDPRTPRSVRWLAAAVVAYALSPIDLIPDFVPVLGLLDDLVLLPLGIALIIKLTPPDVLADGRARAKESLDRPVNWLTAALFVAIWVALGVWLARFVLACQRWPL